MIRLAINGFGRIGRSVFKIALQNSEIEIVAINDLHNLETLAYLLKYDSVYGRFEKHIEVNENSLVIDGKVIKVFSEKNPEDLPWGDLDIDIVAECTGVFRTSELSQAHIRAGAKTVVISAPAKDDITPTFVYSVNHDLVEKGIISNASCTTNCIAPVMKILNDTFGVEKAMMTTIHAYTNDQSLVDDAHKDLRRGRAVGLNIIPTTTGAAIATTKTIPELQGRFDGLSLRVPIAVGSIADITALLKTKTSVEELNNVFKQATENPLYKNVLQVTEDPIVSTDIIGTTYSAIIDLAFTKVIGGNLVKVVAWYDNEWGYSNRFVDMILEVGRKLYA